MVEFSTQRSSSFSYLFSAPKSSFFAKVTFYFKYPFPQVMKLSAALTCSHFLNLPRSGSQAKMFTRLWSSTALITRRPLTSWSRDRCLVADLYNWASVLPSTWWWRTRALALALLGIAWHCLALLGIARHCSALPGIAWHRPPRIVILSSKLDYL